MRQGRRKHIPQRTCVVCRTVRPKRELVRIVRTPEGQVVIDERGKQNGRGAYLCPQAACWNEALLRKRLGAALGIVLGESEMTALREYARSLPEQSARGTTERDEEGI